MYNNRQKLTKTAVLPMALNKHAKPAAFTMILQTAYTNNSVTYGFEQTYKTISVYNGFAKNLQTHKFYKLF